MTCAGGCAGSGWDAAVCGDGGFVSLRDGGGASACSLRNTTNAVNGCHAPAMVAPAQHAIAVLGASPLVMLGNDGGLWRSVDGVAETGAACSATDAQHFDNLNGAIGSLAEVVGFAQDPTDAETLLVGLGANGTAGTSAATSAWASRSAWAQLAAGEGGLPAIDAAQPLNWYVATGAGVSWKQCAGGCGVVRRRILRGRRRLGRRRWRMMRR